VDKAATSQEYVLTTTTTYTEKVTKCHYHLPVALCTESSIWFKKQFTNLQAWGDW